VSVCRTAAAGGLLLAALGAAAFGAAPAGIIVPVGVSPAGAPDEARSLPPPPALKAARSEEHTSELQSRENLVCRLLPEKKKQMCEHSACEILTRVTLWHFVLSFTMFSIPEYARFQPQVIPSSMCSSHSGSG